jgi:hypothetical protein
MSTALPKISVQSLRSSVAQLRTSRKLAFILNGIFTLGVCAVLILASVVTWQQTEKIKGLEQEQVKLEASNRVLTQNLQLTQSDLQMVREDDQIVRNDTLEAEISSIQKTYAQSVKLYEQILDVRGEGGKTQELESLYARSLTQLAKRDYTEANKTLATLQTGITTLKQQLAAAAVPANLPTSNAPPAAGGTARQVVDTEIGQFAVDLIAADLNSTRVVVETASTESCANDCPVNSLAAFVSSAGGYAGINGPYFCPAEYPSCAGKTNSFDTLIMNRHKTYFNSDNNVYSTVPAMIFSGSSARLVGQTQEWGRDTGVDAVIASQPMLLSGGNITFGGDGDPKKGSRGSRSFIGAKDSTVYIGVVRNATVAEVAYVLKALGLQSALNLDSGGSTALYNGGRYLAGPGRNTPFGIVFVRK